MENNNHTGTVLAFFFGLLIIAAGSAKARNKRKYRPKPFPDEKLLEAPKLMLPERCPR
jgi:hypothetical protein